MSQKLFFFDVDGTLIDDRTKEAPQSAIAAVRRLMEAGHRVFFNSGRTRCFLSGELRRFGINSAVCGCGTQVIVDGVSVMERRIEAVRGREIRAFLRALGTDAILEAQEGAHFSGRPFHFPDPMERMYAYTRGIVNTSLDAYGEEPFRFDKFCLQIAPPEGGESGEAERILGALREELPDFAVINRGRGFCECVPKDCTKGSGIAFVQEKYGIGPEDTFVFGDSMNDLSMFTAGAAHRVLMEEHDAGLEPYATHFAGKVLEDGLLRALEDLGVL